MSADCAVVVADAPWTMRDLGRLGWTLGIGAAAITTSWAGASGTPVLSRELAWATVGAAGIIVGGMGMLSWLLAAFRAVRAAWGTAVGLLAAPDVAASTPPLSPAGDGFVSAAGMTRYHRADCLLMRGKKTDVDTAGLRPCGVCQP